MAVCIAPIAMIFTACNARAPTDGVVLDFWGMGREGEVAQQMMPEFEAEHPGVHVHVQQIPWTAAHEKLLTAYVGHVSPDVAQLGNTWVPEYVALGAIVPLDSLIKRTPSITANDYFEGIWATNVLGDTVFGIPWYVDTRLLFYRKDLLAQAGFPSPPTTWAQWIAALKAIKSRDEPGQYPIYIPTNEWPPPTILALASGSPILKDGGRYGAFDDSAFKTAFHFYLSFFQNGLAPKLGINEVGNIYQEFERGTYAMWITGPWNIGEFRRRTPAGFQNKWATAPMPGPTGAASGVSLAGGSSLVIYKASRHPKEAWELIEYLSRPEQQLRFYHLTGDLPARIETWRDTSLADDPAAHAFEEQLHRVVPTPQVPEWELIATRIFDYGEQAIRGGVPADTALARLDTEVNNILERRRWLLDRPHRHEGR